MDLDSSFHLLSFFSNGEYGKVSINLILCWRKVKQDGWDLGSQKEWGGWPNTFLREGGILFLWVESSMLLFSNYVMSDSWWPHRHLLPCPSHAKVPCPSQSPRVCSDLCPLSWWCHSTISSSATRFSLRLQCFPASVYFPMSQLFASGGQSIGASATALVLLVHIQGWLPLGLTGLISLQSKRLSRVFSNITVQKH